MTFDPVTSNAVYTVSAYCYCWCYLLPPLSPLSPSLLPSLPSPLSPLFRLLCLSGLEEDW